MTDKFRVNVGIPWQQPWPVYFEKFYNECQGIAVENKSNVDTVINYQLKPMGGKLIKTKTQGWYLRWDEEKNHTMFLLRWS